MSQSPPKRTGHLIDQNLRRAFQEIEEEELPDRFKDLLARLQSGENIEPGSGSGRDE